LDKKTPEKMKYGSSSQSIFLPTQEAEIKRIMVGGQPGQKVHEILSQPIKRGAWWCIPVIPGMWEA
jgi:hypothetical protein